ncbi:YdeI/OmpD-associated family protein [Longimicrobium sp.]|uniref:YdeI/OmpD-associated family protein n=1 Tax=Longimicrobium sp. TaxID=2029185 RepID=UPI002E32F5A1|nr:YdeI/OmpD-associated family protein [Longimicrobium sp.]HEX6042749.1 YdeI/OmpD-associated family protein [Longimicrobium sp.]
MADLPENSVHPTTRAEWRAWLERNHARPEGVWLVSYKTTTGKPRVPYEEAVEEALCFGWIDSKAVTLDDERAMQWMSPRKPGTGWSRTNKERVERLMADRQIAPPGLAKIEAARADGSWSLLDASEALEVPADLEQALASYPDAARYFHAFPPSVRKQILQWITLAKKPETRAARIAETARLANENVRANQPRPK